MVSVKPSAPQRLARHLLTCDFARYIGAETDEPTILATLEIHVILHDRISRSTAFLRRPRGPFHLFCHPSAVGRGTDVRAHLLEFHARKEFHRDRMSVEWVGEPKLCQQCIVWIRLLDLVCVWI